MIVSGCSNEPVLTETIPDEGSPLDMDIAAPNMDVVPNADTGSEIIEVKTGEKFAISLQSNPTTGYSWQPEFDSELLELVESEFVASSPGLVGAGGVETFVFLAHREGQAEVTLKYQRPWEDQPIEEQSRKVNIIDSQISILNGTVGETITISLISNPTTGYMWHPEFDSEFLELVDKEFVSDSTRLGSPGMETFEFLMLKQGEVKVKMAYKRPWEKEIIDEHITLIKIHPAN
jgi:inhibitor of cysteine peptidase